ncbi:DUF805 domain-containing protein [Ruegeria profundi]|uniref:DUF805 domain-containing protein n=1 Tax=Ruegeria profundi TaxID=1685378 RepID=A0A0X3TTE4_9RHOB|nr:DUF805 domain-containing protein [Ruegeria profundi]KUJ78311.1 hypothetical protein AVO44_14250 [Ruegeria profundi]
MQFSVKTLLSFSGRASRSEYWMYVTPILLLLLAALTFDLLALGPTTYQEFTTTTDLLTGEQTHEISNVTDYSPRIGSLVVSLLVLVPFAAMLTRRVHDIGFPGWYAWLALFLAFFFGPMLSFFVGLLGLISVKLALIFAFLLGVPQLVLSLLGFVVIVLWGTTPSEPGTNEYGPNASELTA